MALFVVGVVGLFEIVVFCDIGIVLVVVVVVNSVVTVDVDVVVDRTDGVIFVVVDFVLEDTVVVAEVDAV